MVYDDLEDQFARIRSLYIEGKNDEAEALLQKCIEISRSVSASFMSSLLCETEDSEVKQSITHAYFLNFV